MVTSVGVCEARGRPKTAPEGFKKALLPPPGPSLGPLGAPLSHFGRLLGRSGRLLGASWGGLGVSGTALGALLAAPNARLAEEPKIVDSTGQTTENTWFHASEGSKNSENGAPEPS